MAVNVFAAGLVAMVVYAWLLFEKRLAKMRERQCEIRQAAVDAMEEQRELHRQLIASLGDRQRRAGISLTEVLISMFVLTVGVLGLAALIPVGGSYLATAQRDDRSSTLGRAAFHDVQVRGYLDPKMWMRTDGIGTDYQANVPAWTHTRIPAVTMNSPTERAGSFCIDPLLVSSTTDAATLTRLSAFPVALDNDPPMSDGVTPIPRMVRGTLRAWKNDRPTANNPPPMPAAAADRIFRSTDDIVFGLPDGEPDGRPFAATGSAGTTRQFTGDYSYFVTVTPLTDESVAKSLEPDGVTPKLPVAHDTPRTFTVSVVTLQKRILDVPPPDVINRGRLAPTERMVLVEFVSATGIAGGDVQLRLPGGTIDDFPEVKPGRWLMLCAWMQRPAGGSLLTAQEMPAVFKWYRVTQAGEPYDDGVQIKQDVTLSGPDWEIGGKLIDAETGGYPTCHAAIIDGVVAVHEKTMRLDTRAAAVR